MMQGYYLVTGEQGVNQDQLCIGTTGKNYKPDARKTKGKNPCRDTRIGSNPKAVEFSDLFSAYGN